MPECFAFYMKKFLEWIRVKITLHHSKAKPPPVSEGDIWWACLGENVGHEINGKGERFTRVVIILRKINYFSYLIIPTSTKLHNGKWYLRYVEYGKPVVACIHQTRTIDYRRLDKKMGRVHLNTFRRIERKFSELYRL
jgi:mRNA interferase MazF